MLDRFLAWLDLRASRTAPPRTAGPTDRVLRVLGWLRLLVRRSTAENAGSALVEFSVTAPLLVSLALGVADYGTMVNQQAILEAATRAGAEYAAVHGWGADGSGITAAATSATTIGYLTASPSQVCGCPDANSGVILTSQSPPCTTACPNGASPSAYISVSTNASYALVVPFPGVSSPIGLTATAIARM